MTTTYFMGSEKEDFTVVGTVANDTFSGAISRGNVRASVRPTAAAEDTNAVDTNTTFSLAELWTKQVAGWAGTPSGTALNFVKWYSGGTQRLAVRYTNFTTGALELRKWNGSSWDSLATVTAAAAIPSGTNSKLVFDYYIKLGNPTGEFRMYVNDVLIWAVTGLDLSWSGVTGLDKVRWQCWSTSTNMYINECLVTDWPTILGKLVVKTTSANGSYTEWAGGGFASLDDVDPASDYMSSGTAGQRATYTMGTVPALGSGESIAAVKLGAVALRDAAGPQNINLMTRISSTDYHDADQALNIANTNIYKIYDLSPATSAVWTVSEINGAQYGARSRA